MPPTPPTLPKISIHDITLPSPHPPVRLRLFYPTHQTNSTSSHPRFPPDPRKKHHLLPTITSRALASYIRLPSFPTSNIIDIAIRLFYPIPSVTSSTPLLKTLTKKKVVVFSHGLVGNLGAYCEVCKGFVDEGCVVVAIEHGDGSAVGAIVGDEERCLRKWEGDVGEEGRFGGEWEWRKWQVGVRVKEVEEVWKWVQSGWRGVGVEGFEGLDVEEVVVVGHSFGGCSALGFAGSSIGEFCKEVVLMDPWLWPMGLKGVEEGLRGVERCLVVKDELSGMKESERLLREGVRGVNGGGVVDRVLLKDATHHVQSDFSFIFPGRIGKAIGLIPDKHYDARELNGINNEISKAYLDKEGWEVLKKEIEEEKKYKGKVHLSSPMV